MILPPLCRSGYGARLRGRPAGLAPALADAASSSRGIDSDGHLSRWSVLGHHFGSHPAAAQQLSNTCGALGEIGRTRVAPKAPNRGLPKFPTENFRGPRFGMQIKEQGVFLPGAYSGTSQGEKRRSDAEMRPKRGIADYAHVGKG